MLALQVFANTCSSRHMRFALRLFSQISQKSYGPSAYIVCICVGMFPQDWPYRSIHNVTVGTQDFDTIYLNLAVASGCPASERKCARAEFR